MTHRVKRRTQSERRLSTQNRILKAVSEVMIESGYVGVRIAGVAERAGISRGAVLHHYPTKDDLILATLQYVFETSLASTLHKIRKSPSAKSDPLLAIIEYGKQFFFGAPFLILTDIRVSSTDNKLVRDRANALAVSLRNPAEQTMLEILIDAGIPQLLAEQILSLTLAIVRGLAARTPSNRVSKDVGHYQPIFDLWRDIYWTYHRSKSLPNPRKPRSSG